MTKWSIAANARNYGDCCRVSQMRCKLTRELEATWKMLPTTQNLSIQVELDRLPATDSKMQEYELCCGVNLHAEQEWDGLLEGILPICQRS